MVQELERLRKLLDTTSPEQLKQSLARAGSGSEAAFSGALTAAEVHSCFLKRCASHDAAHDCSPSSSILPLVEHSREAQQCHGVWRGGDRRCIQADQ